MEGKVRNLIIFVLTKVNIMSPAQQIFLHFIQLKHLETLPVISMSRQALINLSQLFRLLSLLFYVGNAKVGGHPAHTTEITLKVNEK